MVDSLPLVKALVSGVPAPEMMEIANAALAAICKSHTAGTVSAYSALNEALRDLEGILLVKGGTPGAQDRLAMLLVAIADNDRTATVASKAPSTGSESSEAPSFATATHARR